MQALLLGSSHSRATTLGHVCSLSMPVAALAPWGS